MSSSFHGRDLFAPVAAQLALNKSSACAALDPGQCIDTAWPQELAKIVYIDAFGSAMTGIRANALSDDASLIVNGNTLRRATTFSDVPIGTGFWYENSNGLAEVAVNQGRAEEAFNIHIGDPVYIEQ